MSTNKTQLDSLAIGAATAAGVDVISLSTSALTLTGVPIATSSVSATGYLATTIGAATAATSITALPSSKSFYVISSTVAVNLKGIVAGADGQQLELYFKAGGANTLTITPNSTSAATANKIVIMTTAATIVTTASGYASFRYNATDSKWLCKYVSL